MSFAVSSVNGSGAKFGYFNNSNATQLVRPHWGIIPALYLVILACSVLGNGGLFILMVIEKRLHTPFNIYVMNLLFCNVMANILMHPFNIATTVYGRFVAGNTGCSILLFGRIVWATSYASHSVVTANRLWAVWFPLSYR